MKWFTKWFTKKSKSLWVNEKNLSEPLATQKTKAFETNGMHFTVYRANGGYIVEHRSYDRRSDRNNNALHIITDDKELGEEIGKIITFESIRN